MEEKRRHRRVPLEIQVQLHVDGQEPYPATARDISLGGMYISDARDHRFGQTMTIELTLPGTNQSLSLPATVRWEKTDGFGVQFGLLGAQETHAITSLVATKQRT